MPGDNGANAGETPVGTTSQQVISHTVTNFKSGIEPFAGKIGGRLRQPVEVFIESLDNHFASKGITSPDLQFLEAKSHFNLSAGDLGERIRSYHFKDCKSWEDIKSFLRQSYGFTHKADPVLELRSVVQLQDRGDCSYLAHNARVMDEVSDFLIKLNSAGNWTMDVRNHGPSISLENLGRLLTLSVGLASLPDGLVNSFDGAFSNKSTENDVSRQIEKHIGKMQVIDSTILGGATSGMNTDKRSSFINKIESVRPKVPVNKGGSFDQPVGFQGRVSTPALRFPRNTPPKVGPSVSQQASKCYNCNRQGHTKANCRVKYCSYHRSSSHNWKMCRVSGEQRTSPQPPNQRGSFSSVRGWDRQKEVGPPRGQFPPLPNFSKASSQGGKG